MNKEKHSKEVVEIANTIVNECGNAPCKECMWCDAATWAHAEALYNAGYRKQSEVEWYVNYMMSKKPSKRGRIIQYTTYTCSVCGKSNGRKKSKFCPECGAKMKGGEQG